MDNQHIHSDQPVLVVIALIRLGTQCYITIGQCYEMIGHSRQCYEMIGHSMLHYDWAMLRNDWALNATLRLGNATK